MPDKSAELGAVYTTLAMLAVVLMAVLVKWASHGYSTVFLVPMRWAAGLAFFSVVYALSRPRVRLKTEHPFLQATVALCWTVAIFSYYLSLRYIPLLDATLLLNTSALFAPIVARVLAGVREPRLVWLGTGVGFGGVVVMLNPDAGIFNPWSLVALGAGLLMALRVHFNRQLSPSDPKERTTFYSLAVGLAACLAVWVAVGLPLGAWEGHLFTPVEVLRPWLVDAVLLGAVIALGLLAMLQAWFIALGLQYSSVGLTSPFRYTGVIFAAILDWVIWGHSPTASGLIGLGVIVLGAGLVLGAKKKTA